MESATQECRRGVPTSNAVIKFDVPSEAANKYDFSITLDVFKLSIKMLRKSPMYIKIILIFTNKERSKS